MRAVTFGAADFGAGNREKLVMFDRIYLGETCAAEHKACDGRKDSPQGCIFWASVHPLWKSSLTSPAIVFHMNIACAVTIFALDAEMDIFFMSIPDFIMTFTADLFALVHRFLDLRFPPRLLPR